MKKSPLARGTKQMKRTPLKAKSGFKPKKRVAGQISGKKGGTGSLPFKRKTTKASKLRRKRGEWSTKTADNYFSLWIRARDGKCLKCNRTDNLTCSHYKGRRHSITRFDPINCIALCGECHAEWEGPKEAYTNLMIALIGQDAFIELEKRAGREMKRADAVAECKRFLGK